MKVLFILLGFTLSSCDRTLTCEDLIGQRASKMIDDVFPGICYNKQENPREKRRARKE